MNLKNKIVCLSAVSLILIVQYAVGSSHIKNNFPSINVDATYHAAMMVQTMLDHPLCSHRLLPIMNYNHEPDRHTRWGACLRNKEGNIFYLSFPPAYVVLPAALFKILDIPPTVGSLQYFSLAISLLTTILLFLLLNQIFRSYDSHRLISIAGVLIYAFSLESINASCEYCAQVLFQPLLVAFILVRVRLEVLIAAESKIYSGKMLSYSILYCVLSFFMLATEWAAIPTIAGTVMYEIFCYFCHKNERRKYILLILLPLLGAALASLMLVVNVLSMFDYDAVKQYLMSRKNARSGINDIYPLFSPYVRSLGFFSIIIPVFLFLLFLTGTSKIRNSLLSLSLVIIASALIENYLVVNHAIIYSYDRLKFVLISTVAACGIFVQITEALKTRKTYFVTICIFAGSILLFGAYRNYMILDEELMIRSVFYDKAWKNNNAYASLVKKHVRGIDRNKICYAASNHHRANINLAFKRNFLITNKQQAKVFLLNSPKISKIVFIDTATTADRDFQIINDASVFSKDNGKVIEKKLAPHKEALFSDHGYFGWTGGFFVAPTIANFAKFKVGNFVILPDGSARKILHVYTEPDWRCLNVFTEGDHFLFDIPPHDLPVQHSPCYYLTDKNWVRGYRKRSAGFFVVPTPANIAKFKIGKSVILPDGSVRKIRGIRKSSNYLNVSTEGKSFCPEVKPHELATK